MAGGSSLELQTNKRADGRAFSARTMTRNEREGSLARHSALNGGQSARAVGSSVVGRASDSRTIALHLVRQRSRVHGRQDEVAAPRSEWTGERAICKGLVVADYL